jgi:hypothetical protein
MRDMVTKRRSDNGQNRWSHKLTDEQIAKLRSSYTGARGEQTALARQYGISQGYVSMLVRGLSRTRSTNQKGAADERAVPIRVRREAV